jgi:hypothetical protein
MLYGKAYIRQLAGTGIFYGAAAYGKEVKIQDRCQVVSENERGLIAK